MKQRFLPLLLLLALVFGGCQASVPDTTTQAAPATCTVRFYLGATLCEQQQIPLGSCPAAVHAQVPGLTFRYWTDDTGTAIQPETIPVTGDTVYTAAFYPLLSRHEPFLFCDEAGLLHPDAPLTGDDLLAALEALATPEARMYFPGMPVGADPVSGQSLRTVLSRFFPEEELQAALSHLTAGDVTRSHFAVALCALLGRGPDEPLLVPQDGLLPPDVTPDRGDFASLLESAVAHTPSAEGQRWRELDLPTALAPGFVNLDGWLYCVREDGHFLREDWVGDLYFGPDGRYTSGDQELDATVADILNTLSAANPQAQGLDLLRLAFEYSRDSFRYLRKNSYALGDTGWEIEDAKDMFTTGRGNCYNYAAAFWALARGLGYEAYCLSGTATSTDQPHGWVVIEIDGADYFFDPEWEMAYREQQDRYDMDMFQISMAEQSYWHYHWVRS